MKGFVDELSRRNVVRVGLAYAVVAWLIAQVCELALDAFKAPDWVLQALLLVLAIGLPLALILAWAYELTPDGIKREQDVDRSLAKSPGTARKLDLLIIGLLVVAVAYLAVDKFVLRGAPAADVAREQTTNPRDLSVAVMPFVNLSSDAEKEYFADGITEEIINAVVKIPGVVVPARTSVFAFKGHQGDVREVGVQLGVNHVLEGSVRSQGQQVRITAQLIKTDDGYHLWSETYDRKLENIFVVQEEIAGAIAHALLGKLGVAVQTVPNRTGNMAAYDAYLQGRAALRSRQGNAIDLLEEATRADPNFAPSWAVLALAYQSVAEDFSLASGAAEKALALDPDNVDALDAMGSALRRQRRWADAQQTFETALAIDPGSAELLEDYAEFLNLVGKTDQALIVTTRGHAIDPLLAPLTVAHMESLLSNGHPEPALEIVDNFLASHLQFWLPHWLVRQSRHQEMAFDISDGDAEIADVLALSRLAYESTLDATQITSLREFYSGSVQLERLQSYTALPVRDALIAAGDLDYVLETDMQLHENESLALFEWMWTPFYQPLRQHPKFAEYLALVGLIDYWDSAGWPNWCRRNQAGTVTCN